MASTAPSDANPDLDADALFAALEAEQDLDDPSINPAYRAERLQQLSHELAQSKHATNTRQDHTSSNHYRLLHSDPEVLTFTTEHTRAIVHFFHPDFSRCAIMDAHIETLAEAHGDTGSGGGTVFGRVDVKNANFVVEKLGVRVLPCVIGFLKGVAKERITGFEGLTLGGSERGSGVTRKLEGVLAKAGVLTERKLREGRDGEGSDEDDEEEERERCVGGIRRGIRGPTQKVVDSDDDWD